MNCRHIDCYLGLIESNGLAKMLLKTKDILKYKTVGFHGGAKKPLKPDCFRTVFMAFLRHIRVLVANIVLGNPFCKVGLWNYRDLSAVVIASSTAIEVETV